MKKIKILLPVIIFLAVAAASCNNAGNSEVDNGDTTATKDTVKSDPSKFSDPH